MIAHCESFCYAGNGFMQRRRLIIAIACLALLWLGISRIGRSGRDDTSNADQGQGDAKWQTAHHADPRPTKSQGNHNLSPRQRDQISKPPPVAESTEVFSATVDAEIKPGETLVMGGYRTPDGNHEFTLLKPELVTLEDGSKAIKLRPLALSIGEGFALESGMNSLTTKAPIADQNAEAWQQEDVHTTLRSASQDTESRIMTAPTVVVTPGEPFTISVGGEDGSPQYSIEATMSMNANGTFQIQSRTERSPGARH